MVALALTFFPSTVMVKETTFSFAFFLVCLLEGVKKPKLSKFFSALMNSCGKVGKMVMSAVCAGNVSAFCFFSPESAPIKEKLGCARD
jgi:hypothetical protein